MILLILTLIYIVNGVVWYCLIDNKVNDRYWSNGMWDEDDVGFYIATLLMGPITILVGVFILIVKLVMKIIRWNRWRNINKHKK